MTFELFYSTSSPIAFKGKIGAYFNLSAEASAQWLLFNVSFKSVDFLFFSMYRETSCLW